MGLEAVDVTDEFAVEDAQTGSQEIELETDPHRLAQRQKQIDFGKNTVGYQRYSQQVPKDKREKKHPRTPDVSQRCSKRAFDGQIRKWRRMLHEWDLPGLESSSPQTGADTAAKNGRTQRQESGLPLKMTGVRPSTKRSRLAVVAGSFLAALLSPTGAPPEAKVPKIGAEKEIHPGNGLMSKWREMALARKGTENDCPHHDIAAMEEVSYSDDEMEVVTA